MNTQISLKKLLSTALLSMAVVAVPAISQAHERGHRDNHYQDYDRSYGQHNYRYSRHGRIFRFNKHHKRKYDKHRNHKYDKHRNHKYDKHREHRYNKHADKNHKRHYSVKKYVKPHQVAALQRKGLFIYFRD